MQTYHGIGPYARVFVDNMGNTWQHLNQSVPTGRNAFAAEQMWYCFNPIVGPGHTTNLSTAASEGGTICFQAWSGADTSLAVMEGYSASGLNVSVTHRSLRVRCW